MMSSKPIRRLFRLTPGRLIAGLFAFEAFPFLSDRFQWFGFSHHKGWAVLIALASVVAVVMLVVSWTTVAAVFRWRLQFTIRSLLAMTLAASLVLSWLATETKKAKEQQAAVETIRQLRGGVWFDYYDGTDMNELFLGKARPAAWPWLRELFGDDFFANATAVNFHDERLTDGSLDRNEYKWLRQHGDPDPSFGETGITDAALGFLKATPQLQFLDVRGAKVTDAGLEHVMGLTQLQGLGLSCTKVTDAGLEHLKALTQLQELDLGGTKVTDAGIEHLRGLSRLRLLWLHGTKVTAAGLGNLKGLSRLEELCLNRTKVTDAGLEHLKSLSQLESLSVDFTMVTDEGVKEFQHAVPKCQISHTGELRDLGIGERKRNASNFGSRGKPEPGLAPLPGTCPVFGPHRPPTNEH
jgi:hypothetical protein